MSDKEMSVEQIINLSQKAFYEFDMQRAESLLNEGLRKHPNDSKLLGAYGEFCSETGDGEQAIKCFIKSIELMPNGDSFRYFSLAQLQSGSQALLNYNHGLEILKMEISNNTPTSPSYTYQRHQLSRVYCAIAEIFMTDLCDEEVAEEEVLKNIGCALEVNPDFLEAHHCRAQYLKVVGDVEGAVCEIRECLRQLVRPPVEGEPEVSLELRVNISRTLIDLNMSTQAIFLLEGCLQEDESDLQVWYVLSCANFTLHNFHTAKECAEMALQLLKHSPLFGDEECEMNTELPKMIHEIDTQLAQTPKKTKLKNNNNNTHTILQSKYAS